MKIWETPQLLLKQAREWWRMQELPPEDMPQSLLGKLQAYTVPRPDLRSEYHLARHDRADWFNVHPALAEFYGYLHKALERKRVPVYAHTVYRPPEDQYERMLMGFSAISGNGPHQRGAAVDVVHSLRHWGADREFWDYLGHLGEAIASSRSLPIEWGGRWKKPYDPAHFQLTAWRKCPVITDFDHAPLRLTPAACRKYGGKETRGG